MLYRDYESYLHQTGAESNFLFQVLTRGQIWMSLSTQAQVATLQFLTLMAYTTRMPALSSCRNTVYLSHLSFPHVEIMQHCRRTSSFWRCNRSHEEDMEDGSHIGIKFKCSFRSSILKGTYTEHCRLPPKKIVILVKLYLGYTYDYHQVQQILRGNKNTLTNFISEVYRLCNEEQCYD